MPCHVTWIVSYLSTLRIVSSGGGGDTGFLVRD